MKKLETLGRSLSKDEMKKIGGGQIDPKRCISCKDCKATGGFCITNSHCQLPFAGACGHIF